MNFYDYPEQVIFKRKQHDKIYSGIAYGENIILSDCGRTVPLCDVEYIEEVDWCDLTDTIINNKNK